MRLCVDAGPVENAHRFRGIGWCTHHLLKTLTPARAHRHRLELCGLWRRPPVGSELLPVGVEVAERSPTADWTGIDPRVPTYLAERWKALEGAVVLPRDVRRTGADVFLATDPQAVALSRSFATVAILYDLIPLIFPDRYLPRQAVLFRATYRLQLEQLRRADHLVAISESTRGDAIRLLGLPEDRVSVVPLAVDREVFRPIHADEARGRVAERFGVRGPYFVYVGGLDPRKNLSALLAAFREVAAREEVSLVMAGEMHGLERALQVEIRGTPADGRVSWLGYVPAEELPSLYAGSLALAFPSLYEGFGLTVLEAMSCGTPVLTSRLSSLPEVADDAALYADPSSPPALAEGLLRLAREPELRERLRARGLRRAGLFSWERSAEEVLRVCRTVGERRALRRGEALTRPLEPSHGSR